MSIVVSLAHILIVDTLIVPVHFSQALRRTTAS